MKCPACKKNNCTIMVDRKRYECKTCMSIFIPNPLTVNKYRVVSTEKTNKPVSIEKINDFKEFSNNFKAMYNF